MKIIQGKSAEISPTALVESDDGCDDGCDDVRMKQPVL
jgi:hypothetical protein